MIDVFDGQQNGEHILFIIRQHRIIQQFAFLRIFFTAFVFVILTLVIGAQSNIALVIYTGGITMSALILFLGIWWIQKVGRDTKAYITDRRIVRFERVSPFVITKRELFWNEALKAKAFQPNLLLRSLNIGTLIVEPQVSTQENVIVTQVHFAEDLANYIDKILFTFKNEPKEIASIRPFIPKTRGLRGA